MLDTRFLDLLLDRLHQTKHDDTVIENGVMPLEDMEYGFLPGTCFIWMQREGCSAMLFNNPATMGNHLGLCLIDARYSMIDFDSFVKEITGQLRERIGFMPLGEEGETEYIERVCSTLYDVFDHISMNNDDKLLLDMPSFITVFKDKRKGEN